MLTRPSASARSIAWRLAAVHLAAAIPPAATPTCSPLGFDQLAEVLVIRQQLAQLRRRHRRERGRPHHALPPRQPLRRHPALALGRGLFDRSHARHLIGS